MEVKFESTRICSARIVNYLLEKSRVVTQTKNERNYHIFYQFLEGLEPTTRKKVSLADSASDYNYLKNSECYNIPGLDEKEDFRKTWRAMELLKFSESDILNISKVLAAILQIGNLELKPQRLNNMDGAFISNKDLLTIVSANLGFKPEELGKALTYRSVTIRNELSMIPLNMVDSNVARDAFAKTLYAKLFDWLVWKINQTLYKTDSKLSIGILDIFGFEIFENNLFEQFCINYANEKLQQHFNNHIFKLEQDEYKREGNDLFPLCYIYYRYIDISTNHRFEFCIFFCIFYNRY